jgi:hypothetical protein
MEARDLNEAIQLASRIPPAEIGSIEVRPVRTLERRSPRTRGVVMLQQFPMYSYIPAKGRHPRPAVLRGQGRLQAGRGDRRRRRLQVRRPHRRFLYPTPNAGTSKASQAFWQVEDVEREVAELKKRGVVFEDYDTPGMKTVNGILTAGGAKAAWFKDSEGNILAIVQDVR